MARQLGRIAKQLKAAVKLFSEAARDLGEIGQSVPSITTVAAGSNFPNTDETKEQAENSAQTGEGLDLGGDTEKSKELAEKPIELSTKDEESSVDETASQRNAAQAAYGEQAQKTETKWVEAKDSPQYAAYMDNMNFINEVRGFAKLIELEYEHTKKKAVFTVPDKAEKSEEFEEADKEFEELREDVIDFERDVKAAMPIPGTLVSVAA